MAKRLVFWELQALDTLCNFPQNVPFSGVWRKITFRYSQTDYFTIKQGYFALSWYIDFYA